MASPSQNKDFLQEEAKACQWDTEGGGTDCLVRAPIQTILCRKSRSNLHRRTSLQPRLKWQERMSEKRSLEKLLQGEFVCTDDGLWTDMRGLAWQQISAMFVCFVNNFSFQNLKHVMIIISLSLEYAFYSLSNNPVANRTISKFFLGTSLWFQPLHRARVLCTWL